MAASAEQAGAQKWINQLEGVDRQRLTRVRNLRREILEDEEQDPLVRAVLGMTGSPEELAKYQELTAKIGSLAGEPLIVLKKVEDVPVDFRENEYAKKVVLAIGGLISVVQGGDPIRARVSPDRPLSSERPVDYASKISALVTSFTSYRRSDPRPGRLVAQDHVYHNEQTSDGWKGGGSVEIARFSHYQYGNISLDPTNDVTFHVPIKNVLVGRDEIYDHPLFSHGISKVLRAIELHAAAENAAAAS